MIDDIRNATVGAPRPAAPQHPRDPRPHTKTQLPLVAVHWWDSFGVTPQWEPMSHYATPASAPVCACVSVGYLVQYTQHVVAVAPNLAMPVPGGEEHHTVAHLSIPAAAVYRIDQLSTAHAYQGSPTDE